jgi:PhzF family phenazine biosynthesis protein
MQSFVVSAFSSDSLHGNPAAVVYLSRSFHPESEKGKYLAIAREFNLSETAFVLLPSKPDESESWLAPVNLRWFTPTMEVDLCGHATLATAHALFTSFRCIPGKITFSTKSGNLVVSKTTVVESSNRYEMRFPYNMPVVLEMKALPTPISQIVAEVCTRLFAS